MPGNDEIAFRYADYNYENIQDTIEQSFLGEYFLSFQEFFTVLLF